MTSRSSPTPEQATPITPASFQPLEGAVRHRKRWRPLAIIATIGLALAILAVWFVLSGRALQLQITPADAEVHLSGGLALRLGGNYLLQPGQYRLQASAAGYEAKNIEVLITDEPSQRIEVVLAPLPGTLSIRSYPEGADVLLDGEVRGTTPLQLTDLPAGEYALELQAARYLSHGETVTVTGFGQHDELEWLLQPAWGELAITSSPEGAEVSVADDRRGVTPLAIEVLQPGEEVTVKLAGYKQWRQTVAIEAGQSKLLPVIELEPADGLVEVLSRPSGAAVTINGTFRGQTPLELELVPGTSHHLILLLDGYRTAHQTVEVASGQEQVVELMLEPELGQIRIAVEPASAEIHIDGQPRETTTALSLPARAHRLEVSAPGYRTHQQTLTPRPGVEQTLHIRLLSEVEARRAERPERITTSTGQTLLLMEPREAPTQGAFTMGSSRREPGRRANETLREARLERPFYLADKHVTNTQFRRFRAQHSSSHAERQTLDTADQPAVRVTWNDAALYCNWLSREEGLPPFYIERNGQITGETSGSIGYRLPTEMEWEWAVRTSPQGELQTFPWGEGFPPTEVTGNYADSSAQRILSPVLSGYNDRFSVSAPVGRFAANPRGLYDIGGNVAEWVHDWYGIPPGTTVESDSLGPDSGEFRVIRGSSWRHGTVTELRLSFRDYGSQARDDVGFRIARYAE